VLRHRAFQVPDELVQNILIGMANHIDSRGEEIVCEFVTHIRDFGPQGIKLHNACVTRDDVEAPYSFTSKLHVDLQPEERTASGIVRHPRFPTPTSDVMCIVKHRMHHTSPNGPLVLILPVERRDRVITAGPTSAHAPKRGWVFSDARKAELEALALELERMTENWGPDFSYFRAAADLRTLAQGRVLVPAPPGWLEDRMLPRTVPAPVTGILISGTCQTCPGQCLCNSPATRSLGRGFSAGGAVPRVQRSAKHGTAWCDSCKSNM
jgi:hypothetical protein